eukprot:COSAG01_NODE_6116_length_3845_cov_144.351590_2_plen_36_part_00
MWSLSAQAVAQAIAQAIAQVVAECPGGRLGDRPDR